MKQDTHLKADVIDKLLKAKVTALDKKSNEGRDEAKKIRRQLRKLGHYCSRVSK